MANRPTSVPPSQPPSDKRSTGKGNAEKAADSTALVAGARVGLAAYGVVHLLIAWIAVQVAWSGGDENASAGGALKSMAHKPFGSVILWVTVVGLAALTVWQISELIWGHRGNEGAALWRKRAHSAGRAIVYAAISVSAVKITTGSGGGSGNGSGEESLTSRLMSVPFGRWLVAAVGIGIIVGAVLQIVRGITASFVQDLEPGATSGASGSTIIRLGNFGYVTKGLSLAIIGVLFLFAAISYDSQKAGGLDDALKSVREQPFGPYLLTVVALGFAAFGAYCFAWARHIDQ